ncbi:MAG TPA: UDP-3-O-(3-hydroxymyristoyl)glucosamine N-acyltransferase [Nevskia sp.]|jgi:UDP-3-O-[3-hydroxymyristoyl] glucosamine N-acyltransferase|nr:UDP-3-O-(3-hydroxymyristoyl)glucosamine N-acyltransferase [Nevskia sp.]
MAAAPAGHTLGDLARRFGLKLQGDAQQRIAGVCALAPGKPGSLAFCADPRLRAALAATQASAVVLSAREAEGYKGNVLVTSSPELDFCRIAKLFDRSQEFTPGRHPSAVIDTAAVGAGSYIGPHAVIEAGAVIGEGCFIGPNCLVRSGAVIGAGSRLEAQVYVGERCRLGARVQVLPGAVIGSRGFGWVPSPGGWVEKPQLGAVLVGDDVEIGANTCIDRGRFDDTVIENGAKLDNQIQIAHNCRIGANTAIAACVGIAGSTVIGKNCLIGGAAGIGDGLKIADNVYISGLTMVTKSLTAPGAYGSGLPVMPVKDWRKLVARVRRLPRLEQRLALIEQELKLQPTPGDASEPDDF